jgi:hypothetical protein
MKILSYSILSGLIVLLYFFIVDVFLPHAGVNYNSLEVEVEAPLDKSKLIISFFSENDKPNINRDSILSHLLGTSSLGLNQKQLIYQGENLKELENFYGENDFFIVYNDSCYVKFRHFKTHCKQIDSYFFKVYKIGNDIYLKAEIDGTDPMTLECQFRAYK